MQKDLLKSTVKEIFLVPFFYDTKELTAAEGTCKK